MKDCKRIPKRESYEKLSDFLDSHSLDDYWDNTEPAEFEVSDTLRHHYFVPLDKEIFNQISRLAHNRGVSIETLANVLLEQQINNIAMNH